MHQLLPFKANHGIHSVFVVSKNCYGREIGEIVLLKEHARTSNRTLAYFGTDEKIETCFFADEVEYIGEL